MNGAVETLQAMSMVLNDHERKFRTLSNNGKLLEMHIFDGDIMITYGIGEEAPPIRTLEATNYTMLLEWKLVKDPYKDFCTLEEMKKLGVNFEKNQKLIVTNSKGFKTYKRHLSNADSGINGFYCCPEGKSMWTTEPCTELKAWELAKLFKRTEGIEDNNGKVE